MWFFKLFGLSAEHKRCVFKFEELLLHILSRYHRMAAEHSIFKNTLECTKHLLLISILSELTALWGYHNVSTRYNLWTWKKDSLPFGSIYITTSLSSLRVTALYIVLALSRKDTYYNIVAMFCTSRATKYTFRASAIRKWGKTDLQAVWRLEIANSYTTFRN